jgi:hypothetical protein
VKALFGDVPEGGRLIGRAAADMFVIAIDTKKTMKKTSAVLVLAGALACSLSAQPVVTTVVNRTSYKRRCRSSHR